MWNRDTTSQCNSSIVFSNSTRTVSYESVFLEQWIYPKAYLSTSSFLKRWGPCFVLESSLCTVTNSDTMASLSDMLLAVKHFSTVYEPDDCIESSPKWPRSLQTKHPKSGVGESKYSSKLNWKH